MNRRQMLLGLVVQSITVPRASYDRAKIEVDLIEELRADIFDAHENMVNWQRRKRINHLIGELSKEY